MKNNNLTIPEIAEKLKERPDILNLVLTLFDIPKEKLSFAKNAISECERKIYFNNLENEKQEWVGKENVINWMLGDKSAVCDFTQPKFINKIKKLAEKYPDEVKLNFINKNNSINATIPVNYIYLKKPQVQTDEQKRLSAERLRQYLLKKKNENL